MNTYNQPPEKPSMKLQQLFKAETGNDLIVGDNQCYRTLNKEASIFKSIGLTCLAQCDDESIDKSGIHDLIEFCS